MYIPTEEIRSTNAVVIINGMSESIFNSEEIAKGVSTINRKSEESSRSVEPVRTTIPTVLDFIFLLTAFILPLYH